MHFHLYNKGKQNSEQEMNDARALYAMKNTIVH